MKGTIKIGSSDAYHIVRECCNTAERAYQASRKLEGAEKTATEDLNLRGKIMFTAPSKDEGHEIAISEMNITEKEFLHKFIPGYLERRTQQYHNELVKAFEQLDMEKER